MRQGRKVGHEVTAETRAKISKSLKGRVRPDLSAAACGRTQSEESNRKRSATLRRYGPTCTIPNCGKPHNSRGLCSMHYYRLRKHGDPLLLAARPAGPDNPNWKGDEIGYDAAHWRAKSALPQECQSCGTADGRLEIALRKDAERSRLRYHPHHGAPFSPEPRDYARLCITCHRRYDSPRADTRAPIIAALSLK